MAQETVLFREALGDVLRNERMRRGLTLRELSGRARISLGYISEVERGQKEASSELLAALCEALEVSLGSVLRVVSENITEAEAPISLPVPGAGNGVVASAA
jgi:transcriptional regulator with XRE-family HTH domain